MTHSTLRVALALACAVLFASRAGAADPVDPAGTSWAGSGVFKGKLQGAGSASGPVDLLVLFGPNGGAGLGAGEFRLSADDGLEVFELEGTYALDAKGQPLLTPDLVLLEDELKDLMIHICEDVLLLGPGCAEIATLDAIIDPAKLKLKAKTSAGNDGSALALGAKLPFVLTDGMESARVSVSLKASPAAQLVK